MQIHGAFKQDPPTHVIKNLLLAFPDSVRETDANGMLPLHHAAKEMKSTKHNLDGFHLLLKAYPAAVTIQDDRGRLPVHLACRYGAPQAMIDCLFKNSPLSVSVKDQYGKTPLCYFKDHHRTSGIRSSNNNEKSKRNLIKQNTQKNLRHNKHSTTHNNSISLQQHQNQHNPHRSIYNVQPVESVTTADVLEEGRLFITADADDGSYCIVPGQGGGTNTELTLHTQAEAQAHRAEAEALVTFGEQRRKSHGANTNKSNISNGTVRTEATSTVASQRTSTTKNLEAIIRQAETLLKGLKEASESVAANKNGNSGNVSTAGDASTFQSTTVTGGTAGIPGGGENDAVSVLTSQSWKNRPGFQEHQSNGQYWRDLILGFNDGLVSTFLLAAGVSGGGLSVHDILITGIAGAVGGAISMASGEYLATKSQDEVEQAELAREKMHIAHHRRDELRELRELLLLIGMNDDGLRKQLTEYYAQDDEALLQIMTVLEFGILEEERRSPILAAIVSGVTFTVGALPSVLPYAFVDDSFVGLTIAGVLTGIGLAFAGAIKTTATNGSVMMAAGENVLVAGIGGLIAFYVGELFELIT